MKKITVIITTFFISLIAGVYTIWYSEEPKPVEPVTLGITETQYPVEALIATEYYQQLAKREKLKKLESAYQEEQDRIAKDRAAGKFVAGGQEDIDLQKESWLLYVSKCYALNGCQDTREQMINALREKYQIDLVRSRRDWYKTQWGTWEEFLSVQQGKFKKMEKELFDLGLACRLPPDDFSRYYIEQAFGKEEYFGKKLTPLMEDKICAENTPVWLSYFDDLVKNYC